MSDHYYASIEVWGTIKEKDLEELAEIIANSYMEDVPHEEDKVLESLRELAGKKDCFEGSDGDARWGQFEDLESFLNDYEGLSYIRYAGSSYDCGPSKSWKVNGKAGVIYLTHDDEEYVSFDSIKHFHEVLKDFKEENAPQLINDKGWAEEFIAKHFLEKGQVPTILDYVESQEVSLTPGALTII